MKIALVLLTIVLIAGCLNVTERISKITLTMQSLGPLEYRGTLTLYSSKNETMGVDGESNITIVDNAGKIIYNKTSSVHKEDFNPSYQFNVLASELEETPQTMGRFILTYKTGIQKFTESVSILLPL
jgi:hypothetical protein